MALHLSALSYLNGRAFQIITGVFANQKQPIVRHRQVSIVKQTNGLLFVTSHISEVAVQSQLL